MGGQTSFPCLMLPLMRLFQSSRRMGECCRKPLAAITNTVILGFSAPLWTSILHCRQILYQLSYQGSPRTSILNTQTSSLPASSWESTLGSQMEEGSPHLFSSGAGQSFLQRAR